jgi:4-amino-4-deoxy-L-arabinose transferase-like glycosyltransferase
MSPRGGRAAVVLLTAAAFVLRVSGLGQSLYGDEIFTHDLVSGAGLTSLLSGVHNTSITPPLHYVLAWLFAHFGDDRVWIRVPSLLAGTATVPALWALGKRTVGRPAALAGAALAAIGPFAIFYGQEARAYALVVLLVTLAALGLVRALEGPGRRWDWALFAVSSCAALYSHYTSAFAIAALVAWAFWRHRAAWKATLLALVAIAVGYLPWLPFYLDQRKNSGIEAIGFLYPLSVRGFADDIVRMGPGHAFLPLSTVPGLLALWLLAFGVAFGLAGVIQRARTRSQPSNGLLLVVLLALAAPVGEVLYSVGSSTILAPRNLMASFPGIALSIGALLTAPRPRALRLAACACAAAALGIGLARSLEASSGRPDWHAAARWVDEHAGPGEPVFVLDAFSAPDPLGRHPLERSLGLWLSGSHPLRQVPYTRAAAEAGSARAVTYVFPGLPGYGAPPAPVPPAGMRLVGTASWPGFARIAAFRYARR